MPEWDLAAAVYDRPPVPSLPRQSRPRERSGSQKREPRQEEERQRMLEASKDFEVSKIKVKLLNKDPDPKMAGDGAKKV